MSDLTNGCALCLWRLRKDRTKAWKVKSFNVKHILFTLNFDSGCFRRGLDGGRLQ